MQTLNLNEFSQGVIATMYLFIHIYLVKFYDNDNYTKRDNKEKLDECKKINEINPELSKNVHISNDVKLI